MKSKSLHIIPSLLMIIFSFKNTDRSQSVLDNLPQLGKNSIEEILQVLTIEEKVNKYYYLKSKLKN